MNKQERNSHMIDIVSSGDTKTALETREDGVSVLERGIHDDRFIRHQVKDRVHLT